jgi:flagellum-specific peptidoglycan hydrolase FlgJ
MTTQIVVATIRAYIRIHWFKLSLLTLILFACFRKELSFSIRMNANEEAKKTEKRKTSPDIKVTGAETVKTGESTPLSILGDLFATNVENDKMPDIDEATQWAYLKRFKDVAVGERKKYGIPSSIIVANALRQSFAGTRDMTLKSNNHFAIPCSLDWSGSGDNYGKNCYRHYENAWLSFRDHSIFITSGKFSKLRNLGETNYKAWAVGLQSLGYPSGSANLTEELIKIIEAYGLDKLDKI